MTIKTGHCGASLKVFALAFVMGLAGCDDSAVIQKDEVKSPDGAWTARAEVEQNSGPGQDSLVTHVYLLRGNDNGKRIEVLSLNDKTTGTAQVQMHWRDNRHLDVSHFPESEVKLHVANSGGVEVSVH